VNLPEQHGRDGTAVPIDIQGVQKWRKLFILAGLFALLAWTPLVRARPEFEHPVDVPLSFHPAATRVLGLVTPRSVG